METRIDETEEKVDGVFGFTGFVGFYGVSKLNCFETIHRIKSSI